MGKSGQPETIKDLVEAYVQSRIGEVAHIDSIRANARHVIAYFGHYTLEQISEPGELVRLMKQYALNSKLATNTIIKRLRVLQSSLYLAWKMHRIALPAFWFPEKEAGSTRVLTSEERERLLDAADGPPTPTHVRTFLYLVLFTGQSKTPIVNLTWDRVRDDKIEFDGSYGRGRVKVRIHDRLRDALLRAKHERKKGCNHVIQWRGLPMKNPFHAVRRVLNSVDLEDVTLHDLCRSAIVPAAKEERAPDEESPRLFISYSNDDGKKYATDLDAQLKTRGRNCFLAYRDMKAGAYPNQLSKAITDAEAVVLIVTPRAAESPNVLQEIMKAHRVDKTVVPVIVNNSPMGEDLDFLLGPMDHIHWTEPSAVARTLIERLEWGDNEEG